MHQASETSTESSEFRLLFSTTNLSPMAKLAIMSIDSNTIPKPIAFAAFVLSQIQVLSLLIKAALMCFSNSSLVLSESFSMIHNTISIGDSFDFNQRFLLSMFIIAFVYIYLLFAVFLLLYLLKDIYQGNLPSKVIQKIWGIGAYLHVLVFFYPIHTVSLKVISVSFANDEKQVFGTEQAWTFMEVSSCMAFIINSILSVIVLIYLLPPVKAGFALASKTKKLIIMDIALKFILPFLWMLDFQSNGFNVFLIVFNAGFCLLRDLIFFKTLPFYNMIALRISAKVYAFLTLFAVGVIISEALSYDSDDDFDESPLLVGILWLLVVPLVIKVYSIFLQRIFHRILFSASGSTNPYYLAQYWYIFKDIARKRNCLQLEVRKFNKGQFRFLTFIERIMNTGITNSDRKEAIYSKNEDIFESANYVLNLGIGFLKHSVRKHPLSVVPKLALASHYLKYHHSYQTANHVIYEGLEKTPSFTKTISFSLVLLKLIRKLRLDKSSNGSAGEKGLSRGSLSIEQYLSLNQKFHRLKEDIKYQLEPQIKFWKNFKASNTDLDSFISLAQSSHQRSKRIARYIKNYQALIGPNFNEPILTLGLYLSFVQNDALNGGKLMKRYDLWNTKPKSNNKNMANENMMNSNSVYFVVSASFHDLGKIINYSKNANQILSIPKESMLDKSINMFAPGIYGHDNEHILGISLKEDISASLEKPRELPILDREGNLLLCWVNITLEFLPKAGLSYCILLRPVDVMSRMVLIKQNGLIMHSSERFKKEMGIIATEKKSGNYIFSFCQQLSVLIRAFLHVSHQGNLPIKQKETEKIKSNEGETVLSVTEIGEKDELKDTIIDRGDEYLRLYEKYRVGESLIFYPFFNKPGDSSPLSAGTENTGNKSGTFAKPIAYKTTVEVHSVGNEKVFKIKLKEVVSKSLDAVWANLDPALKVYDMKKYTTYRDTVNSLKSLKSKGFSPLLTKNSGLSNHLARTSILGEETQLEEKFERMKSNATNQSNTLQNSCDLRESDQEIIVNEPLQQSKVETNLKRLQTNKVEKEEEVEDEDLKMKIIKLGVYKRDTKMTEKWLETVEQVRRQRSSFRAGSDILANFKDINIGKIVNEINNNNNNNQHMMDESTSVSSRSRIIRSEKTLQNVLKSRNHSKTTIAYSIYALLTAIAIFGVVLWFSFNASDVSQRVKTVSEALQNIYMRCFWTNLANQETRIWTGVRGGIINQPGFIDIGIQIRTTNTSFHKMDQFNSQLWESVNLLNEDIKQLFMDKNVGIYERDDSDKLVPTSIENTFQTTTRILSEGFRNVYKPVLDDPLEDYIDEQSRFIFDNSHNDLLIASEHLIQVLTENMDSAFSSSEALSFGILLAGIGAIILIVVVSVGYIMMVNKDYHIFANVLITLPQEDALRTELILQAFHEILEKDYEGFDCIEAIEAAQVQINHQAKVVKQDYGHNNVKKGIHAASSKMTHKISIMALQRKNIFLLIKLLLVMACVVGGLMFYYYWSLDQIRVMEKQQMIINSSLDNINLQSMISVELQSLVMDNATSEIRHQPIRTVLNNDMERLAEISELEKNFRDASGELPDLQLRILRGYNCLEVKSDLYLLAPGSAEEECANLAHGTGILGLVEVITGMKFQLSVFLADFEVAVRDAEGLKVLYLREINDFIEYLDVGITMFLMSYSFTLEDFKELVESLVSDEYILALVGVIVTILIGAWCGFSVIYPLTNKEFDKKTVLSLFPPSIIFSNRHIKIYIVRNANARTREARYLLK